MDTPRETPKPSQHPRQQDARVTAPRPLGFTTWRAFCRLTQEMGERGAKRGELCGAACAGQDSASCAGGPGLVAQSRKACASFARRTPTNAARALLYGSLCMAADSCGVMGKLWGLSAGVHASWSAVFGPGCRKSGGAIKEGRSFYKVF